MSEKKPEFYLTGRRHGPPTVDDLIALFRRVTGREPSQDDINQVRAEHEMFLQTLKEREGQDGGETSSGDSSDR